MKPGDEVVATKLDGETVDGVIDEILADRCDEHEHEIPGFSGETLADYWRGHLDDPSCPVVRVDLNGKVYDWPAEMVEVVG